ncbi:hypothetical protein OG413_28495 [Streptomyces sp. NBC_01433]|uniref:hypothetical protein n=1 Tax=Streptomyces sp. NBC_01433 TaxID=2903864 RepID=UPI002257B27F|nr:hypothetical protein [Streptomyces sp. NBC_01433]MCX4679195.1 hypothetical protein [Streptomyces sp. NBC_01433]
MCVWHGRLLWGNPVEGVRYLLRRGRLSSVATAGHLIPRVRRGLRRIQYRSDLMDGCHTENGLAVRPA